LLADAVRERASDIHLDSQSDQVRVRFRIDGTVRDAASVPMKRGVKLLRYLKVNSNLDPAPSLLPADSHFDYELDGAALAIRLACAPCVFGDKISLRLFHGLPARQRLADIGLCVDDLARIQRWLGDISGMFVVAGPVGCGKTTTLYALLSELNLTQRQIITIEDPVEYRFENINQIEVNTKRGLTFEEGLRSILRLDPDYILLGEIRDKVSAMAAMEAAATGRVVLTTMHGRNATGVITALRSLGVSDYEIAASLAFIVGQRLVRKLCTDCRRLEPPTAQECHWLESLGEKAPGSVWRPGGCPQCAGTGYFERTGVFEVLPVDEQLYDMIVAGKDEHALRAHLRGEGFRLLLRDALAKAAEGFTDLSELTRIGAQSYLDQGLHFFVSIALQYVR
jgi:type II secretory ATPase GspE/PulE/Tfp pilus assembly ATPase PilB-like protein